MPFPTPNHDEDSGAPNPMVGALFLGNFHKTLPHDEYGEVDRSAYREFERSCLEIEAGSPINFEEVRHGPLTPPFASNADPRFTKSIAKFTSPLAGASTETHGPDPKELEMPPAPGIFSASSAAEMVELYWMALLRDKPLAELTTDSLFGKAVDDVEEAFRKALADDRSEGALRLGLDLRRPDSGPFKLTRNTLFRCGLHDEEYGPLVSQFFLRDIPYGVQTISSRQVPYRMGKDFLTGRADWLRAQNTGKDKFGRDYATCNNYADQVASPARETYFATSPRFISTIRDLARFVNRDALHQAYFNAALFLDAIGAPLDQGNPYGGGRFSREGAFATLGGPDLLTLVSEVSSRALKVVWRQKWLVHRRARPEVYGGLLEMQFRGLDGDNNKRRDYGLPSLAIQSEAAGRILESNATANGTPEGTYFLPMAFSAGSPAHPAYGAGHATVAGACVTVLKAWFDEDRSLNSILAEARQPHNAKEPGVLQCLLQPGKRTGGEVFEDPQPYVQGDMDRITVGGELNKLASNVAMGRSMGGVHWRSDNTRSLRLGEKVAIEILRKRTLEYAERPVSFTFRSFDRQMVQISRGQVRMS